MTTDLERQVVGLERECVCWHVFDRNEGRTGTIRKMPVPDREDCGGTWVRRGYPTLARKRDYKTKFPGFHGEDGCAEETCVDGYIPDITGGKLLDILLDAIQNIGICRRETTSYRVLGFDGDTLQEALLRAVLATASSEEI